MHHDPRCQKRQLRAVSFLDCLIYLITLMSKKLIDVKKAQKHRCTAQMIDMKHGLCGGFSFSQAFVKNEEQLHLSISTRHSF